MIIELTAVRLDGSTGTRAPAVQSVRWPRGFSGTVRVTCVNQDGSPTSTTGQRQRLTIRRFLTDRVPLICLDSSTWDFQISGTLANQIPGRCFYDVVQIDEDDGERFEVVLTGPWDFFATASIIGDQPTDPVGEEIPPPVVGETGPAGLSLLHGSGPPDPDFGRDDEFYIDDTSPGRDFYGPKTAGDWGDPFPLITVGAALSDIDPVASALVASPGTGLYSARNDHVHPYTIAVAGSADGWMSGAMAQQLADLVAADFGAQITNVAGDLTSLTGIVSGHTTTLASHTSAISALQAFNIIAGNGLIGGGNLSTTTRTVSVGQHADNSIVVNANDIQLSPTLQTAISTNTSNLATVTGTVGTHTTTLASHTTSLATIGAVTFVGGAGLVGGGGALSLGGSRTFDIGQHADNSIVVNVSDIQLNPALQTAISASTSNIATLTGIIAGHTVTLSDHDAAITTLEEIELEAGAGMTGGGFLNGSKVTFNIGEHADASITVEEQSIRVSTALQTAIITTADDLEALTAVVDGLVAGGSSVPLTRTITTGAGLTGGGDLSTDRTLNIGQNADNSITVNANDIQLSTALQTAISNATSDIATLSGTVGGHTSSITALQGRTITTTGPLQGGGTVGTTNLTLSIDAASGSGPGTMSAAQFNKLAGLAALTTKGDLLGYDSGPVRVPVDMTDGWVLTIDAASAPGWKWAAPTGGGGGGADALGTYLVQTAPNAPVNAQVMASLATGIVKNTTATGVQSIAVANTDYAHPSATYIVKTSTNAPSSAQVLGSLTSGFAKIANSTGVVSTQATILGTDLSGFTDTTIPVANSSGQLVSSTLTFASNVLTHAVSASGANVGLTVSNTSNTASATANLTIRVAGTTAGAPTLTLGRTGASDWNISSVRSTNDLLQFIKGTTVALTIDTSATQNNFLFAPTGATNQRVGMFNFAASGDATAGFWIQGNNFVAGNKLLIAPPTTAGMGVAFLTNNQTKWTNVISWVNPSANQPTLKLVENGGQVTVLGSNGIASATSATWDAFDMQAATATLSGTTAITTAAGFNLFDVKAPTITAAGAVAITNAATVRIAGAPIAAGSATVTNAMALWIASGDVVMGTAALATTATSGFLHGPTCAGTPTGVPATYTGRAPVVYDTTNDRLYVYNAGWQQVGIIATGTTYAPGGAARIPYANSGATALVDHASLQFDDTNIRLGVGPGAPTVALDITQSVSGAGVAGLIYNSSNTASATATFTVKVAGSTAASPKINLDTGTSGHIWTIENLNSASNDPLQISWDGFRGLYYDMLGPGFNIRPTGSASLELNIGGVSAGGGLVAGIHLKNNSTAAGAMLTLGTNFTNTTGGVVTVIYDTVAAVYKNAWSTANRAGAPLLKLVEAGGQVTALGTNTLASAASLVWDAFDHQASTLTLSGSTNVTTATGLNYVDIKAPTITSGSAVTVTAAATLRIGGAPTAGGSTTLTKSYSLWIDAGLPRIDSTSANGSVATVLGSVGPTGANTTVQEWLTMDINGTTRYLPCF